LLLIVFAFHAYQKYHKKTGRDGSLALFDVTIKLN